ncbi:MAG: hypothetical protein KGL39_16805 [Patescibacteria group bacterium]|nr:hypothetical protein [Patescibacteria group bacterium]
MSTQHTPGPWTIEAGGAKLIQTTCMVISADDGLGPVAYTTKDNARLIAAAPELLAALNAMLSNPNDPRCWANGRAAIAKATGA